MRNIKPLNVLAFTLLVLSIGVYATTQLMPSYAADPTTFMSCETGGGGCAVRLNTTSHIIVNATDTLYYPTNGTYTDGNGLNMTEGFISFHQQRFRDFDVGGVHSVVFEDTNRDGEARLMLLGGTIATPQTTTLHFMPRFDNVSHIEIFSIFGNGTAYVLRSEQVGTGVLRPIIIQMDGNDIITFSITNTLDFNNRITSNVGAAGNDFGAVNLLVETTITPNLNILTSGGFELIYTGTSSADIKVDGAGASWNLWNDNGAGGDIKRLEIVGGAGVTNTIWSSVSHTGFTLGADMDAGGFDVNEVNGLKSPTGQSLDLIANFGGGGAFRLFTHNGAAADTLRLSMDGNVATSTLTMSAVNFAVSSNNTLSMFSDAVRVANIFSVVNTAKSQVTGLLLESDFTPNIGESFATGDIVCFYSLFKFTKCNSDGDSLVIGPVYILGERGIIGHENVTKYRLVKETEYYAKNVTDADGNILLTRAERPVKEAYRSQERFTLDNGTIILRDIIKYRSVWINESYVESIAIWGEVSSKILTVIEGPLSVKACGTVLKGQFLVAGIGGCAKGVDTLTPDLRYFGIAVSNSRGGYVEAYMP